MFLSTSTPDYYPDYIPAQQAQPDVFQSAPTQHDMPSSSQPDTSSSQPATSSSQPDTSSSQPHHVPSPQEVFQPSVLPPRRSSRPSKLPSYLQDYHCPTKPKTFSTTTHWCNLVHFTALSSSHQHHINQLDQFHEPTSYKEAAQYVHWVKAMQAKIDALKLNNTWSEVVLPPGKKAISSKWVFKVKLHADGSLERYKARLVVRKTLKKRVLTILKLFHLWSS